MRNNSNKKGSYGYIRRGRKIKGITSGIMIALVFVVYFGALKYFGTNQNYFSIAAALIALPAAMRIVSFIMFMRAGYCSEEAHRRIEKRKGDLKDAYDLYMTSDKKNFQISHLCVSGSLKRIIALSEDAECNAGAGEKHIREILAKNGIERCSLKIYKNLDDYLNAIDRMRENSGEHNTEKADREIIGIMCAISI